MADNREAEADTPAQQHSPGSIQSHAEGASVIQVETLGRLGMFVILGMFVVISGVAVVAGYSLGVGEARAENMNTQMRTLNARVEVLQYDLQDLRAKTGNSHENSE